MSRGAACWSSASRNRFAIAGDADLQALRASGVAHCWIDAARRVAVVVRQPEQPPAPMPTYSPRDELERASAISASIPAAPWCS